MKLTNYYIPLLLIIFNSTVAQHVNNRLPTSWTVNSTLPLNQYPRPQLERSQWQNLNGYWQYAITPINSTPTAYEGKILVPYPVESALSEVQRTVGKDSLLWYKTNINIEKQIRSKTVLLHFGAVDWKMTLWINGQLVGKHEGGFDPFYFDISSYLKKGSTQEIVISVWDPTDNGPQPNGKQVTKPGGIWYTPVTGIWQTVWIEGVSSSRIESIETHANIDTQEITLNIKTHQYDGAVNYYIRDQGKLILQGNLEANKTHSLRINHPKLWSPDQPFLYDLALTITRGGKIIDSVSSYFAMRKISLQKDEKGIQRLALNNNFLFQFGPLDQGWWPDGLYTAPTDEALKFDIEKTKEMGFNTIRKHLKIEPARWYYYCDKIGMLVWQDMPSGDLGGNAWDMRLGNSTGRKLEKDRTAESEAIYRKEWNAIISTLKFFPSIVVWVPFNEAWGQFKTREIAEWTKTLDSTRLVNSASGGNFFKTGDIVDIHNYPEPHMPDPQYFGTTQALVLGEYGGLGLPVQGHTWQNKNNWGYQSFKTPEDLKKRYAEFINTLEVLIPKGLSAAIYTQTTDVEIETNGLMTYDRKITKIPVEEIKKLNIVLYNVK